MRTLVRKGEEIEARLRSTSSGGSKGSGESGSARSQHLSLAGGGIVEPVGSGMVIASNVPPSRQGSNSNASSSSSSRSSPPSIAVHTTSPQTTLSNLPAPNASAGTELYNSMADIFRDTAALYLQTVINEPSPGVPEIIAAHTALATSIHALPQSIADRALTLPLCLAGCLASQVEQREYFKRRLAAQENAVWSAKTVRMIIDQVCTARELQTAGSVVDWRTVSREYLMNEDLLLA